MEPYRYLTWLILFLVLPLVILWVKFFKYLKPHKRTLFHFCIFGITIGIFWDYIAMKLGVWYFIHPFILKRLIFGYFPLEEFGLAVLLPWLILTVTILAGRYFKEIR